MEPSTSAAQVADAASIEATRTAALAREAVEASHKANLAANNEEQARMMEEAVIRALGRGTDEKRYIDTGRIPFICDDIRGIHSALGEINVKLESFGLVKMIVFSFVGAVLLGVLGVVGTAVTLALQHGG